MLEIRPNNATRKANHSASGLVKAIAACCSAALTPEPFTASSMLAKATPGLIEAAIAYATKTEKSLGQKAWAVLRASFAYALADFFSTTSFNRPPASTQLEALLSALLSRADILAEDHTDSLTSDAFLSPLKLLIFRDFSRALAHETKLFEPDETPDQLRRNFEDAAFRGLQKVKDNQPDLFREVEDGLTGPSALAQELRAANSRHQQYIIRAFSQTSIFGQELTGITLSDLYVRQRCLWATTKKESSPAQEIIVGESYGKDVKTPKHKKKLLHLSDLHGTLWGWLNSEKSFDAVRVVAGGPGSGKSTFAKAFAIEAIDCGRYDVLFVPLQDLPATGSFETRISTLMRNRSELGFDRVDSPLEWMAKSNVDGSAPYRKLLLVCDGLDELAAPDSKEATAVTTDFIQNLNTWLGHRNSSDCRVKALILGRTISAEEAFSKLHIDDEALLSVAGFLPVSDTEKWVHSKKDDLVSDPDSLSEIDQRAIYWEKWCSASGLDFTEVPPALDKEATSSTNFVELTAEPLLLYLLIWTGFLGDRWREASNNRNIVYLEMFKKIYARDWGAASINLRNKNSGSKSGHTALSDVTEGDFFALQETLGLASWGSGGRTVSSTAFEAAKVAYLSDDQLDDMNDLFTSSLKSVALQSYTRSVEGADGGYEFVHKTLGEYLIGRALVGATARSTDILRERVSDNKSKTAAALFAKVGALGPITPEIDRFFADELRLRFSNNDARLKLLDEQLVPIMNWVLRRGMPVHETIGDPRQIDFAGLVRAARRSTDALWCAVQHLGGDRLSADKSVSDQFLPIKWPSFSAFSTLLCDLTDRGFVNETKRIPSFDYVNLEGQALTEQTFGSVIYEVVDSGATPRTWLRMSAANANLANAQFYMADLRSALLDGSIMRDSQLSGANLEMASMEKTDLTNADLEDADLSRANLAGAVLVNARLGGSNLFQAILTRAKLHSATFGLHILPRHGRWTLLIKTDFTQSDCRHANFGGARIENCNFEGANLKKANFSKCKFSRSNSFDGAQLGGAQFTEDQLALLSLSESQTRSIDIIAKPTTGDDDLD